MPAGPPGTVVVLPDTLCRCGMIRTVGTLHPILVGAQPNLAIGPVAFRGHPRRRPAAPRRAPSGGYHRRRPDATRSSPMTRLRLPDRRRVTGWLAGAAGAAAWPRPGAVRAAVEGDDPSLPSGTRDSADMADTAGQAAADQAQLPSTESRDAAPLVQLGADAQRRVLRPLPPCRDPGGRARRLAPVAVRSRRGEAAVVVDGRAARPLRAGRDHCPVPVLRQPARAVRTARDGHPVGPRRHGQCALARRAARRPAGRRRTAARRARGRARRQRLRAAGRSRLPQEPARVEGRRSRA